MIEQQALDSQLPSFKSRLQYILGKRKQNPWGASLGLSSNMITRMFRGEIPGWDALSVVMHTENVSPAWLTEGKGMPFMVNQQNSDEALGQAIQAHELRSALPWECYLCTDYITHIIILKQPADHDYKGNHVSYHKTEIEHGPIGHHTITQLLNSKQLERYYLAELNTQLMQQIRIGEKGTFELFGSLATGAGGLLSQQANQLSREQLARVLQKISDQSIISHYDKNRLIDVNISAMRNSVKALEAALIEKELRLNSDQKAKVISAIYRQVMRVQNGENKIEIDQDTVFTMLEVV